MTSGVTDRISHKSSQVGQFSQNQLQQMTLSLHEMLSKKASSLKSDKWENDARNGTGVVSKDDDVAVLNSPKLPELENVPRSEEAMPFYAIAPGDLDVTNHAKIANGTLKNELDAMDLEKGNSPARALSKLSRSGTTGATSVGSEAVDQGKHKAVSPIEKLEAKLHTRLPDPESATHGSTSFRNHLKHKIRQFMKDFLHFKALKASQILLSVYIMIMTFADIGSSGSLRDPKTGYIIDHDSAERTEKGLILINGDQRAIVATSAFQVGCLGLARLTAWFMYPALVFVFISKFRATLAFLSKSPLAMHMYSDSHELHVYCGWTILWSALIHTICHLARWGAQGNMNLLVVHFSGITGLIIIVSCLLICIPMTIFRERIRFEVRKKLHFLFILFAAALAFHTPKSAIPNGGFTVYVFGGLLAWYFLDATYCFFFMTEKIDTTKFNVVPSGVRMTRNVSERFQKVGAQGGICYVCLPWIAKDQWHAFSLFENPSNPAERQIFIQKTGDWTSTLHRYAQRETVRPAWIHGPFPSPYDNADAYDNQILVASGIGITPALSVIRAHKDSRRINLIWAVRDHHLLHFFLQHLYLDHEGWNLIYYTGKEKLRMPNMDVLVDANVCIIEGRPKLHAVIPNIIYGIESGKGLPENYTPTTRAAASELLADRLMDSSGSHTSLETALEDLTGYASELGFHLPADEVSSSVTLSTINMERSTASKELMSHLTIGFCPWDQCEGAKSYVKQLDPKLVLPTWGMLYCGGARMVLADLEQVSEEYGIGLHVESFKW